MRLQPQIGYLACHRPSSRSPSTASPRTRVILTPLLLLASQFLFLSAIWNIKIICNNWCQVNINFKTVGVWGLFHLMFPEIWKENCWNPTWWLRNLLPFKHSKIRVAQFKFTTDGWQWSVMISFFYVVNFFPKGYIAHKHPVLIKEANMFIGKVVFICFVGSVNSVLKFLGQPGETRFQPGGDEISSGVPMSFNTKLRT